MSEQNQAVSGGFVKAFVPGLIVGFVIGAAVGVIVGSTGGNVGALTNSSGATQHDRSSQHLDRDGGRSYLLEALGLPGPEAGPIQRI